MSDPQVDIVAWSIVGLIYVIDFFIRVYLLIYIPKNRKPTAATAWLLLIYIIPVIGTMVFFILGSTKLSKRRRHDQLHITHMIKRYTANLRKAGLVATIQAPYDTQAKLAETFTGIAPTYYNASEILSGYENLVEALTKKVHEAKQYVYVEFFAMALDDTTEPFFQALEAAVARGVDVRVLFDMLGSRKYPRYKEMQRRLSESGVKWRKMLPISLRPSKYNRPDLRNHRKIVVVDNTDGYIGSLNMIDKTYHRKDDISYIELAIHFQGPSVNEAAAVFASDWYCETGEVVNHFMKNSQKSVKGTQKIQIVPSGPGYTHENNLKLFVSLIHTARQSILITNPYLVPDEPMLNALISAAQRGVEISILNSEAMDQWMVGHAQRSYYEELMRAGITISLYKRPQLVHEKFMTIDDEVGVIGSSNLDIRSFVLNHECSVVVYEPAVAKTLAQHHKKLLENSRPIKLEAWLKRSTWHSFLDSIARLTSALQ